MRYRLVAFGTIALALSLAACGGGGGSGPSSSSILPPTGGGGTSQPPPTTQSVTLSGTVVTYSSNYYGTPAPTWSTQPAQGAVVVAGQEPNESTSGCAYGYPGCGLPLQPWTTATTGPDGSFTLTLPSPAPSPLTVVVACSQSDWQ